LASPIRNCWNIGCNSLYCRANPASTLQTQLMGIAALLEEKSAIPMIAAQLALLQEIQSDPVWESVAVAQLENVRRKLRFCLIIRPRATHHLSGVRNGRHMAPFIAPLYPIVQGITDTARGNLDIGRSLLIGAPIPHEWRRCAVYTLFRHM
jgi:hypothetical protein